MSTPPHPSADAPSKPAPPALAPVHDFAAKLRQAGFRDHVAQYVAWHRAVAAAKVSGEAPPPLPVRAPLSLNLDLTTACNYACAHCVDWDILNSGRSYEAERLDQALTTLAERGLRSVILIGGGEPTVHPRFREVTRRLKALGLQVAVVTNGGRGDRIHDVVDALDEHDWIRLSLDAGTDPTFQSMHRPKKPVRLEEICAWPARWKERNPRPRVGFSFVVTWRGAERTKGAGVVENLGEIVAAARLARESGFDYISYKPFLVRTPGGAEVIDPEASERRHAQVVREIRLRVDEAKGLATDRFAVVESTNLKLLESGAWRAWTSQPRRCHMQVFRQVLSPLGLWNCPAHRGVEAARIADRDAYAGAEAGNRTLARTAALLERFDAASACREVTCLYHDANWWLERAIEDPRVLGEGGSASGEDLFL